MSDLPEAVKELGAALTDAADCIELECGTGTADEARKVLAAVRETEKLRKALAKIEWARITLEGNGLSCPNCKALKERGHYPDCIIGLALAPPAPTLPPRDLGGSMTVATLALLLVLP